MNKYKYLFKNIGLLTISNFGTKILSFILIPIYTSILSTADYGTYDVYSTTVSLFVPILTLNVIEAVMRFSLDSTKEKRDVFTIGLKKIVKATFVVTVLICANDFLNLIDIFIVYPVSFMSGKIKTTDKLDEAIQTADFIYCTYPAFMRKKFIEEIEPYIKSSATLGFIPAYGGAEFFCKKLIKKGVTVFGLQKPPYVCRTKERGKIAGLMSKKKKILMATIPQEKSQETAILLEDMLGIRTEVLPNYMNVTLLPGNPLLHTSGSYYYLKDYKKGDIYPQQIYYYQQWNDECSKIICRFSDEMMNICRSLPIDLSGVQSIQTYYESPTPQDLTKKFHSIPSFQPLKLPMIRDEAGFIPDFSSRFFIEDIPYGVCTIKALAKIVNVPTPTADKILSWYKDETGKEYFDKSGEMGKDIEETAIPQLFGIDSLEKLVKFYCK